MTSIIILLCTGYFSIKLYNKALYQSEYVGLPTVPCQDYTLSIKQNYSLSIKIMIHDKAYLLPSNIGHDFGKCLHDIYTNDTSGTIFVRTNDTSRYTLGQFFDVWRVTFNKNQVFGYLTTQSQHIEVFVNNRRVDTYRNTPLLPNETIQIIYQ